MDNQESHNPFFSVHTPIALLALALCTFFFAQNGNHKTEADLLDFQSRKLDKQITDYKAAKEQLAKGIEERRPAANRLAEQQNRFRLLLKKVNDLKVDGDEDAKAIIAILVANGITNINAPVETAKDPEPKKESKDK